MKQVLQSYGSGELRVVDAPAPIARPGFAVVRTHCSIISPGTERMVLELARASLLGKARARPDQVRKVLDKVRREGLLATLDTVRARLDEPMALGYACVGTVVEVGDAEAPLQPGTRVACTGFGYASHASFNAVPYNLCAAVPPGVDDEVAALAGIAAMALHAMRQAEVGLGTVTAVIGLGLLGQLAVQLARAAGARVVAIDVQPSRVQLARACGATLAVERHADGLLEQVRDLTDGFGVDSVLVFAATRDNDPLELAAQLCRDRGRVVAFGAVRLDVPRNAFYAKELELRLSRSTGPGRYDPLYEEHGVDYPIGYVRWTQGRNLSAWLELCRERRVDVARLLTHRVPIEDAARAYALLDDTSSDAMGIALTFDATDPTPRRAVTLREPDERPGGGVRIGLLGAGQYASGVLAPLLAATPGAQLGTIVSAGGTRARHVGERTGFALAASESDAVLADPRIDLVVIASRHAQHAAQAAAALAAGKHVLVEKPLALDLPSLEAVLAARRASERLLVVGFNRRWAPMVTRLKRHFGAVAGAPLVMQLRVNAGLVDASHWTQDPLEGGGRVIGEVCHFVDLCCFLRDTVVERVSAMQVRTARAPARNDDQLVVQLALGDGSVASITYAAGGDRAAPKELIEVMGGGRMATLLDYRRLELYADGRRQVFRAVRPDKGQRAMLQAVVRAVEVGAEAQAGLMSLAQLESVARATLATVDSAREGRALSLVVR